MFYITKINLRTVWPIRLWYKKTTVRLNIFSTFLVNNNNTKDFLNVFFLLYSFMGSTAVTIRPYFLKDKILFWWLLICNLTRDQYEGMDLWVGGLSETHVKGGQVFYCSCLQHPVQKQSIKYYLNNLNKTDLSFLKKKTFIPKQIESFRLIKYYK